MSISWFVNWLCGPSRIWRGLQSNVDPQTDTKNKYRCGISLLFTCSSSSRSKSKDCPREKPKAHDKTDKKEEEKGCPPEKPKAPMPFLTPEKPKEYCRPEKPKEHDKTEKKEEPKGCNLEKPKAPKPVLTPKKLKEPEKPKPKPFWATEKLRGCWPPKKPKACSPGDPNACSPNNPDACSPNNPDACSPNNPNACSPEKPKETLSWNEWDERLEAFCDMSAISNHTMYNDYGPAAADDFDHNPANFFDQWDVNGTSVGPSSILRPPTFPDNQHVINKMMENESHNNSGTPNALALEYLQHRNDTVLEVESNTDYTSCGQNDNIITNQRQYQNEGSDTDYEELFDTTRLDTRAISSKKKPVRAYNRRTTKIKISREHLQRHFEMTMDDAAKSLDVSRSTLKRICRENDIERWPTRRKGKNINDEQIPNPMKVNINDKDQTDESTRSRALMISTPLRKASSSHRNVTIKAMYGDDIAKFPFSVSSGLNDLKEKVCQRLELNIPIKLKCMDDDGDLIVISCNDALHELFGKRPSDRRKTTFDFMVFPVAN